MLTMFYMLMHPELESSQQRLRLNPQTIELVRAASIDPPHEGGIMMRHVVYDSVKWRIDKVFGEPETAMLNEAVKRNGWEAVAKAFATDGLAAVLV